MGYKSLRESLLDLERHRHLVRVGEEVDPHLEMAEIQRRAYLDPDSRRSRTSLELSSERAFSSATPSSR